MTREQRIVAMGAASGVAAMIVLLVVLYRLLPAPIADSAGERIAYALRWNALAALPLFAMVVAVGNARFSGEAIDPTRGAESRTTIIDGRVTDNTLQQFALFFAGSLALAVSVAPQQLRIVGAAAIVFVIMRLAFWIGYRIDPLYRAFGFSSTAYLNLGLLLAAGWFALA